MHTQQYAPAWMHAHFASMYSGLPVMKMSHAVTDIAFNCRSEFMTKVVTFGRTMMRLTDTVKAVTHLAAGQLCL